jgi:ubiquinone/menaquinone biosynthesis C-methylase UbiE
MTTNAAVLVELAQLKQGARAAWAAGDFPAIAQLQLWEVGARIVDRMQVRPGEDVLDVACGTGNAALRAAQAGGRVVGVDLTPELFEAGRRLAADAGVAIEWVQGDAEELPADDESFDVVLSTFGCMFAPRHAVTALELARVLRPGGRMGLCSWTPDGAMGQFFQALGSYLPSPSPLAQPPVMWGDEQHVCELFEGTGIELEFARELVAPAQFESTAAAIEFFTTKFGPLLMARQLVEAAGRWEELKAQLGEFYDRAEPAEYLVAIGRKA